MWWTYTISILSVVLIYRWWQLKRSIRRKDYDFNYYEDGPYGKKKRKKTLFEKFKSIFKE